MLSQHDAASITQMFLHGGAIWGKTGDVYNDIGILQMTILSRRSLLTLITAALLMPVKSLLAGSVLVATDKRGVALDGYDTTAYWQQAQPQLGIAEHVREWRGVPWHFESEEAADMFADAPETFTPRFGGYCTRAMSFGKVVNGDPQVWRMYQGKLYLFAKPIGGKKFDEGEDAMIDLAQMHWDTLD